MKYFLMLIVIIAGASCQLFGRGFRARFGIGLNAFYSLPQTEVDAIQDGWLYTDSVISDVKGLKAYCFKDYIYCIYYDDNGFAAGVQVGFSQAKYQGSVLDWEEQGFTSWTAPNGEVFYTTQQYFVDEAYMKIDAATRKANYDDSKMLQNGGVWVKGFNKELFKIPDTKDEIEKTPFTRQGCLIGMGNHYFYNMTENLPCNSKTLFPRFALEYYGRMVGMGVVTFGQLPENKGSRDWFERPHRTAVQIIVPRGSECLYNMGDNPGLVTTHIYFVNFPLAMTCLI